MRRFHVATAFLVATALVAMGTQTALAVPTPMTVYDSIPANLPGNVPSQAFQATQTSEFGDHVRLAPGPRFAKSFTVVMSSWACESGSGTTCVTTPGTTFTHPITLTLYSVAPTEEPGSTLLTQTETFAIPYRPTADNTNCSGGAWFDASDSACYNGFANTIEFDLSSSGVALPSDVIWGISFNTQSYGPSPMVIDGPYNSLNVGVETFPGEPSAGTDVDPDGAVLSSTWTGAYCDLGVGGTGTFRNDTTPGCWTDFRPLAEIETEGITSPTTLVVDPANVDGWTFDEVGTASHAFVAGPSTPPLGTGSLSETVGANGDDYTAARNSSYNGVYLDTITKLSYSTYVTTADSCQATYLSLGIDTSGDAVADNRIYFEPCYQNGGYAMTFPGSTIPDQGDVVFGSWQTWDADSGGWWDANGELSAGGPPLFTLADYLNLHPGAQIAETGPGLAGVRLLAGGGAGAWDNFQGNTDAFTIGVRDGSGNIAETTYDFEPAPVPSISLGAVAPKIEGNTGTSVVNIPVTLSGAGAEAIDVHWATGGGTATPGADYVAASGDLHWNAGDATSRTIQVSVIGDLIDEPNQTFVVTISAPVNASIATGSRTVTIVDNDGGPRISIGDAGKVEGNFGYSSMNFLVTLNRPSEFAVTVRFYTANGSARSGSDYASVSGTLTFPPGTTSMSIAVPIRGDRQREAHERFSVKLYNATNSSILRGTGTGTIFNDD